MECSVERLQLQRKIIFVAYPARELLTRANDDHRALCLTIRSLAGWVIAFRISWTEWVVP